MAQAQSDLAGAQALYVNDVLSYWSQVPQYELEASAFAAYAAQVRSVAVAWDRIQRQRDDYAQALADYTAAVQTRDVLVQQQADAQASYDAALAACAAAQPSATPTPSTTPTGSVSPSPQPTVGGCPPPRPPILDAPLPVIPPVPTPPPDPRPS